MEREGTLRTKSPRVFMVVSVTHTPCSSKGRDLVSAKNTSRLSFTKAWGHSGENDRERPVGVAFT